ncbi:2Fe-2S iron-sulfur cluster-binding protein [Corynebacterium uterequi]|uniref:NADH:ubiquinone oxidoreductase chain G-like protein n=1 Tax=Corynebacterium uterequi TaxID=1072256 RepID=A0A0G3HB86_9CORY|nr:2Fe-2S iron-sulfur cluster-binding protein [Corynebacterium uterequi]AKK10626.1 NADH:ubiquinone oxidoreductase chain G-like protein [Corynebacterium uterequi]
MTSTISPELARRAAEKAQAPEMVTCTIDGVEVTVAKGTLIIRAAEEAGISIPRFCDHTGLKPAGACRQCLVEIPDMGNGRAMPKPQASCSMTVMPGMVVNTQHTSEKAERSQRGVMELLLINHPLDCPVCDKGGECPLQNQAMEVGGGASRYDFAKREFPKPIALVSNVLLDRERCISCTRCTRFQAEIAGDRCIVMAERGARQQVSAENTSDAGSYFMGNTVQICPVGALTSADYRFQARPFDLVSTETSCEHCASACPLRVDHRHGTITRRLAGEPAPAPGAFICDRGRYGYKYLNEQRVTTPLVRTDDGELVAASWTEALAAAAAGLSGRRVGVIGAESTTVENSAAFVAFAEQIGAGFDYRHDRIATREHADFVASLGTPLTLDEILAADQVVLVGLDPEDEAPGFFLRLRHSGIPVVAVTSHLSIGTKKLNASLVPAAPGQEAAALDEVDITEATVIVVGDRAAETPGLLTAIRDLVAARGCSLAWVPATVGAMGYRGAALAGTRSLLADAEALVLGYVDDRRYAQSIGGGEQFIVQLTPTMTPASDAADVILPVASVAENDGHFVDWFGSAKPVNKVNEDRTIISEARVLAHLGRQVTPGTRPASEASADAADARYYEPLSVEGLIVDSWRELMSPSEALKFTQYVGSDARRGVAKVAPDDLRRFPEGTVTLAGCTYPVIAEETMAPGVIWVPRGEGR